MVGGDIEIASTIEVSFRPREIDYLLTAFGRQHVPIWDAQSEQRPPRPLQA
jgi:hypothetical protein